MSVSISWSRLGNALVGGVEGRVDSQSANTFADLIKSGTKADEPYLILDFSKLEFITSAGLRILLLCARDYKNSDRMFGLCSLPEPIQELVEISGFRRIVQVYDSKASSVESMTGERPEEFELSDDEDSVEPQDWRDTFDRDIIRDRFSDIAQYVISKHESLTGTDLPPEVRKSAAVEIEVELQNISREIRRKLRSYRKKLFITADVRLKKVVGE
ncbi:MAG: STAS domain-containing protein [Bacteroidetes bacterium]|nr:STAS domain-containing protein [Bacteroidota bacterium]